MSRSQVQLLDHPPQTKQSGRKGHFLNPAKGLTKIQKRLKIIVLHYFLSFIMAKKVALLFLSAMLVLPTAVYAQSWQEGKRFKIATEKVAVYTQPDPSESPAFDLYENMVVENQELIDAEGIQWLTLKAGSRKYFVPAAFPGGNTSVVLEENAQPTEYGIVDHYGILKQPHRYTLKLVKMPGAKGRMEVYEKTDEGYTFKNAYDVKYPKEGPKAKYGDLKTVGGPVVRYVYRTTRSAMNGWDSEGSFGVYKVSFPMPHDALPYLMEGKMTLGQYNKIPAINKIGEEFYPHPGSMLGADIVIHTARKGSRGCIILEHSEMAKLYRSDMPTENDKEIIPLIIYDEDRVAPPEGTLF